VLYHTTGDADLSIENSFEKDKNMASDDACLNTDSKVWDSLESFTEGF